MTLFPRRTFHAGVGVNWDTRQSKVLLLTDSSKHSLSRFLTLSLFLSLPRLVPDGYFGIRQGPSLRSSISTFFYTPHRLRFATGPPDHEQMFMKVKREKQYMECVNSHRCQVNSLSRPLMGTRCPCKTNKLWAAGLTCTATLDGSTHQ